MRPRTPTALPPTALGGRLPAMDRAIRRIHPACGLAPVLAACLLAGCDTPPNVAVESVHCVAVGQSSPTYVELGVDLLLENPTDNPIQLETFEYSLSVGSSGRWSGSWSALRTLPARKTVRMQLPAVVEDPFTVDAENTSWQISGSISYKAPGRLAQILFDTGFRRPSHDFSGRGEAIPAPGASTESPPPTTAPAAPDA